MRHALLSATTALVSLSSAIVINTFAQTAQSPIRQVVDSVVNPWIAKDKLPGVAVAVSLGGKESFYFYGQRDDAGNPFRPDSVVAVAGFRLVRSRRAAIYVAGYVKVW